MEQEVILYIIIGMSLITIGLKALPILVLSNIKLPEIISRTLRHVPIAVLSSMVVQFLIIENNQINFNLNNIFLWASIPTIIIAFVYRSIFLTVVGGMVTVIFIRFCYYLF